MNPWWWVPIGLAGLILWFAVAVVVALVIGPVLAGRSCGLGQDDDDQLAEDLAKAMAAKPVADIGHQIVDQQGGGE